VGEPTSTRKNWLTKVLCREGHDRRREGEREREREREDGRMLAAMSLFWRAELYFF
jgi:hypothetical protein